MKQYIRALKYNIMCQDSNGELKCVYIYIYIYIVEKEIKCKTKFKFNNKYVLE